MPEIDGREVLEHAAAYVSKTCDPYSPELVGSLDILYAAYAAVLYSQNTLAN
jgi:hypothetical protein